MDVTWFILLLFVYLINDVAAGAETAATKRYYANIKKLYNTKDRLHRKNVVLDARSSLKKSANKQFHYIKKTGVGSNVFKRWPLRLPYEVPMDSGPILTYENYKMLHAKASIQLPKKNKNPTAFQTAKKLTNPASGQTLKKPANVTLVQTLKKKLNPSVSLRSSIFPCLYDGSFEKKKQCIEKAPEDFPEELNARDQKIKVMYHRLPEDANGAEDHIVKIVHRPNVDVQVNEPQKLKNLRKLQYQETTKSNEENKLTNVNKEKLKLKKLKDDSKTFQSDKENNSLHNSEAQVDINENIKTNAQAQSQHNSKFHGVSLQNNEKDIHGVSSQSNENYESAIDPAKEDLNFLPVTEKSQEEIQDLKNEKIEENEKSIPPQQVENPESESEKSHKMKTGQINQKTKEQNVKQKKEQDVKINKAAQLTKVVNAEEPAAQLTKVVNTEEPKQQENKNKNSKEIKEKNEDLSETWKALAQVQEESLNKKPQPTETHVQQESLNKNPNEPESSTEESKLQINNKLNKESKDLQKEAKQGLKAKEESRLKQSLLKEEAQFQSEQRPTAENNQVASNEDANQEPLKQLASAENEKLPNLNFRPRKEKPDQRPSDNFVPVNNESPVFQHTQQMKLQADQMNNKPCKGLNQQLPCVETNEHSNEGDPNIDNQFFQLWREDLSIKQKFIERMNNMDTKYLNLLYRMGKSLDSIARTINHFGTVLTEQSKGEAIRHALNTQQLPQQQQKQDNSFYKRHLK